MVHSAKCTVARHLALVPCHSSRHFNSQLMTTVKERLQHFLKEEGISASEFCRKMGLSSAYLNSMRKSMPEEKVERLQKIYPQINRDWLLYGEGEMYRDMGTREINPHKLHRHMVPLVPSYARAGSFDNYVKGVTEEDCVKVYSPVSNAELAIRVSGDSMEPEFKDHTILFLEKINDKSFIPWGNPLVLDTENGSVVKAIYPSEKGEEYVEARSYNRAYPPFQIPVESIYGMYRILADMPDKYVF